MRYEIRKGLTGHPFQRHWQFCIGSGHAPLALRDDYRRMLEFVHRELGIRYVRFHGILSDDMEIMNDFRDLFPVEGGEAFSELNFRRVAAVYDNILQAGMKPFVELSFMPKALARDEAKCYFYYREKNWISPPADYEKWGNLVKEFVRFLLSRYGAEEVESWYFEVWNEPDLDAFWSGTKEEYFTLYAYAARALKEADSRLKVGGPATSNSKWVSSFLRYCGENHVPVDFVSTHQYAGDPVGMIEDPDTVEMEKGDGERAQGEEAPFTLARMGKGTVLDALRFMMPDKSETDGIVQNLFRDNAAAICSRTQGLPLFYTEWSENAIFSAWTNDTRKEAAYCVKASLDTENTIDGSSYWCFSDLFEEFHLFPQEFHGGFGLLTQSGIPKPGFYAFWMLKKVGGCRLELGDSATDGEIGIAAFAEGNKMEILLFRQKMKSLELPKEEITVSVPLNGKAESAILYRIDEEHGNPLKIWKEMGSPDIPNKEQLAELAEKSAIREEELEYRVKGDQTEITVSLGVNDVHLICIVGEEGKQLYS